MRHSETISIPPAALAKVPVQEMKRAYALATAELRRRQDELLDEALLETFPASDPVSVVCII